MIQPFRSTTNALTIDEVINLLNEAGIDAKKVKSDVKNERLRSPRNANSARRRSYGYDPSTGEEIY